MITDDYILDELRRAVRHAGSQVQLAKELEVSESFISLVLAKKRPISTKILAYLGYEKLETYQRSQK